MRIYRPRFWAQYVDDTFVITKREKLKSVQSALNSAFQYIEFTMEAEKAQ